MKDEAELLRTADAKAGQQHFFEAGVISAEEVPHYTPNEHKVLRRRSLRRDFADIEDTESLVFTCDDCAAASQCPWVFDAYNTDGDCIAVK